MQKQADSAIRTKYSVNNVRIDAWFVEILNGNEKWGGLITRHCEERSDEAIQDAMRTARRGVAPYKSDAVLIVGRDALGAPSLFAALAMAEGVVISAAR